MRRRAWTSRWRLEVERAKHDHSHRARRSRRRGPRTGAGSQRSRDRRGGRMSAVTVNPSLDAAPARRPPLRLVRAELLKLRRRRGLVALCALLTVAPMIVGFAILAVLHATDAAGHGPAGGIDNLAGSLDLLCGLGMIAALLVGTTAGA